MRDRLKRRKKEPEKAGTGTPPPPLQPAFYDNQPQDEGPASHHEDATPEPQPKHEVEPDDNIGNRVETPGTSETPGRGNAGPKRRRRRGRGGRGRGPSRVQSTDAQAQAATETPSAPPAPAEPAAADQVAAEIPAAPPRPPKGTVILAIGLPGSGKSSWFHRHKITPLSSDLLRQLLFDDPTEQRFQDLIFSNLRSMLKARLIAKRPMNYVDATNLTAHDRHGWIKLARDYGYEVQAVFFDVPVETCLERNRKRERVVPEDVMRRMAGKLKAPTFEEGFSRITVVRVKQKEPGKEVESVTD